MINRDRLAQTFKWLISIDSVSKFESDISNKLKELFLEMGAQIFVDDAGLAIGSNTGNLIAKFKGNFKAPALLINAHMDTVEPGKGIKPVFKDGIFRSDGSTILGADDKSAIAIIIEVLRVIIENKMTYCPLEIVLTICEEIGLSGAKHLDYSLISAKYGYALDTTDTNGIVTKAPSANKFEFVIHGKDAHAGTVPENGINAIFLASKAIANLTLGRIDHETTCNIGRIEGGIATNIVPSYVSVKGEARSHDEEKLDKVTQDIINSFKEVIDNYKKTSHIEGLPSLEIKLESDFKHTNIPDNHPIVVLAKKAAQNIGQSLICKTTGGGADANIFFEKGIITGVLGTGMMDMHTVRENISLDEMVKASELLLEIIKLHSRG